MAGREVRWRQMKSGNAVCGQDHPFVLNIGRGKRTLWWVSHSVSLIFSINLFI